MKEIRNLLKERKKKESKISNERQEILATILAVINAERAGTQYKPMTGRGIAMKLAYMPTKDLWWFHRKCSLTKGSYGRCFFGCLKVK